jgi:site-specific recombinase XerD
LHIEDALERFLLQLEADGRSPHTTGQYARHVRTLARWARDVGHGGDVAAVSHEDVARFLASPQARDSARGGAKRATTVNALRGSLRGFFRYLHEAGHVPQDPTRLVRRALCGRPPPKTLSEPEQERLLFTLANADGPEGQRDSAMFHLMLATGLRVG